MDTPSSFPNTDFPESAFPQDETQHIVEAALRQKPLKLLIFWTMMLILGIFVVAGVDVAFIFQLFSQRSLDVMGAPTTATSLLVVESLVTLIAFFVIGEMFSRPGWPRFGGTTLYVVVVAFLATNVFPLFAEDFRQLWGATFSAGAGGLGASADAVTDPPTWFSMLMATLLAVMYTIPGLAFTKLKQWVAVLKESFEIRSEALAVMELVEKARVIRIQAQTLRNAATTASDPSVVEDSAKAAVTDGIGAYCDGLTAVIASNVIKMTDSRGVQQRKRKIIADATTCLNQAQSIAL